MNTIKLILTLLPLILQVVEAVEAAFPEGGQGAAKLAMVRKIIEVAYKATSDMTVAFDAVWPVFEQTIAAVVATYNTLGTFKKS